MMQMRNAGPTETAMKTLLTCIAFAIAMGFASQAFASDANVDCTHVTLKHGHYVCDFGDAS